MHLHIFIFPPKGSPDILALAYFRNTRSNTTPFCLQGINSSASFEYPTMYKFIHVMPQLDRINLVCSDGKERNATQRCLLYSSAARRGLLIPETQTDIQAKSDVMATWPSCPILQTRIDHFPCPLYS